jgi:hypothetical protein
MDANPIKCEKGISHQPCFCPKNHDGSSKGMEATEAIQNVVHLHNDQSVFLKTYVMDNDSSRKAIRKDKIDARNMTNEDWPRTASERKKNDNGQLPLSHPKIEFVADKNHHIRTYTKYYFELSHTKKSESICTNNGAKRMKRNCLYFIHMYHSQPLPLFQRAAKAVLKHHFNNHEFCDEWCPWKKWGEEERIFKELKYQCKEVDNELYLQFHKIHMCTATRASPSMAL